MKSILTIRWLLAASLALATLTSVRAEEVPGQVIDAVTGRPLEGANVQSGQQATTTDPQGRFLLQVTAGDSLDISFVGYQSARVAVGLGLIALERAVLQTPEVVVEGGLVRRQLDQLAASVTVVDGAQARAGGGLHVQDVTQTVPNLNWAGGTSRPRYFQIRGIGERSHYAGEGPPNFSVGFVLDDIDMSGMGTAGLLFDVDQIEVFKGPQSTIFGPNALAGLINLQSADPHQLLGGEVSVGGGNDGLGRFSAAVNIPLAVDLALRLGYAGARADGFRRNDFLDAEDTNRRREQMLRAKIGWTPVDGPELLGTLFWAHMDNGYDAWVPDNNEDLVTYSDKPGKDRQETIGASLKSTWNLGEGARLVTISAFSDNQLEHSFDGDWGSDQYWLQEPFNFDPAVEGWNYDFFDRNVRDRTTLSQEARLLVGDIVVGGYWKRLEEEDDAAGYLFGGDATDLVGRYQVDNLALYGQWGAELFPGLRLELNARLDRNDTAYKGDTNGGAERIQFAVDQWLEGGKAALSYDWQPGQVLYASASRGYRSGGVNQHPYLAAANRPYDPEYMLNFELGWRARGARHSSALMLFHALRSDQQVSLSSQQDPGDPNSFFFFTANAAKGRNSGVEVEQRFRPGSGVELFGSLGLLATHVDPYSFQAADGVETQAGDREAAHAPSYTFSLGGQLRDKSGLGARLELTGMDQFFYSDSHDQESTAYQLVNGQISYHWNNWSVQLWGRNLLDERYGVRGFFFALEPPDYADKLYVAYGDPRQVGLQLSTRFFALGD
ncbi:MAG: TonB-dependent receptor [Candidatus Latescibacteria bacterium]|nr:TonB-dependent receptor [Candidatus Latescibacterota bacterium]